MAEILKTYDFRGAGRLAGYPWDEWFDGKIQRLTRGKDFMVSMQSLRAIASIAARRHGVVVHIHRESDDLAVLQAARRNGVNGTKRR